MRLKKTLATLILAALGSTAHAAPSLFDGSFQVGYTGEVLATFWGHTASYSDDLYFSTDNVNWSFVFNNHASSSGDTVSLGSYAAGTELFFKIYVNNTGDTFYTGPGSKNADGLVHVVSDTFGESTYVGFEDILGGGDLDYDDLQYSFHNIAAVPEPETYAMLLAGLGVMGAVARRKKK